MIILAIIEYAILASTFTLSKVAVRFADPLFLIGVRMLVAAFIMFVIYLVTKKQLPRIHRKDGWLFFATGIFHIFLPFVGEFWALQYVSSSKTAITYGLTPFFAALLSFVILKSKLSLKQVCGLVLGLTGILPLVISKDDLPQVSAEFFMISPAESVLLLAVISASYAWFLVSDLMKRGYSITIINGVSMFIGGLLSFGLWFVVSGDENPVHGHVGSFIFWTGMLIVVANIISYNFYGWLLNHMSINLMSALGFLCPIFASFYGVIFLHEEIGLMHVLALSLVVLGLILFYQDEMRKKREAP